MNKLWTKEELDFLKTYYPIRGSRFCAEQLNRTLASIRYKAHALAIRAPGSKLKTTAQYEEELLEKEIDLIPREEYLGALVPIKHECYKGHIWKITPSNVLHGIGCPSCSRLGFDYTKPAILYYIKISKDFETYYKIGITNKTVSERFCKDKDKSIEIINEVEYATGAEAYLEEQRLLELHKTSRVHIVDFLASAGNTELFEYDILNLEKGK